MEKVCADRKPRANKRHLGAEKGGFAEVLLPGETPLCGWRG